MLFRSQEKTPEKQLNEVEIGNLPEKEFRIMIKGSIQEIDITIVNIYIPSKGTTKCIEQILTDIKGEIDNNTIMVGNLTPHLH